ncbi:unnamed protein product [Alternaria alternata]
MVAHRRGPWSQHEDQWLVNLVARNGPHNWVRISQEIGSRSPKQCRERYHQNLKPSLNHDPITGEEGELIEKMVAEMGKRWAEIARRLKGRSDNAVKNWWNGGQNRRKRNPERPDQRPREHMHHPQTGYHYPAPHGQPHHEEHRMASYHESHRPSLNTSMNSPHVMKLPQPQRFEPFSGSRPQPLDISAYGSHATVRARGFETPMPSPSGYSIVSADGAPSLITDTGSESRSPRGAASPLDITLAPLVGSREERKSSLPHIYPQLALRPKTTLPTMSTGDEAHYNSLLYTAVMLQHPSLRLRSASQTTSDHNHQDSSLNPHLSSHTTTLCLSLRQQVFHNGHFLPFHSLAEPTLPVPQSSSATTSPAARQLPSPYVLPSVPSEARSAPVSPKDRMSLRNIM